MRVGFFGGSFDPPHHGHLAVARAARDRFHLNEVLLAPTGRQPLKPDGPAASFQDRLAMTALLCAEERGLKPSAIEAPLPDGSPNYTADTLYTLRDSLPVDAALFCIVGADAFLGFPKWKDVDALFTLADWVVVSRPGVSAAQIDTMILPPEQRACVHSLDDVHDPTSATDLRARLRAHLPCDDLLPAPVLNYIRQHKLYGC